MSPTLRTSASRLAALVGFLAVAFASLSVPLASPAGAAVSPPAPYSAAGTGDVVDLTAVPLVGQTCDPNSPLVAVCTTLNSTLDQVISALGLPATSVANLHLVGSDATANSQGINGGADRTHAHAANLDPLTATSVDLSSVLSQVSQSAPPDNAAPATAHVLDIPASSTGGLVDLGVSDASALAHWAGDGACVSATEPLAEGRNDVANVSLLPTAVAGGVAVVGPGGGAVQVDSTLTLPTTTAFSGNDPRAVQADSTTQVAAINLFGNALTIDVVTPPKVTANATGIPNTASASFTQPVLTINGNPVVDGQDISSLVQPILSGLSPALSAIAPLIGVTLNIANGTTSVNPDGTSASATASLLQLHLTVLSTTVLDLNILPLTATATAPAGGLDCGSNNNNPVHIAKTASRGEITPGESFNYTITFSNTRTDCTLTNTTLTDVITGPAGSEITGSDPAATSTDGLTITWGPSVVGDIPPGGSKAFTVTVKSPTTAVAGDSYDDTATGAGDCNGTRYTAPFTLNDIPKIVTTLLARTGGDNLFPTLGMGALAIALLGFRRLRRA